MTQETRPSIIPEMLEAIETDLQITAQQLETDPYSEMGAMIAYHMGWTGIPRSGGKRLRPLLALLCCSGNGTRWEIALPAASALEFIHNFSLIHDDIEDQSDKRRGRPTIWKRWGVAQAINTGDAMHVLARLTMYRLRNAGLSHDLTLDTLQMLDQACLQLTRGQYMDLAFETENTTSIEDYVKMVELKTSALLAAATGIGASIGGASNLIVAYYHQFGYHLGQAFQILDDILGIWGEMEITGKPAGDDLRMHKKTLPILYGLEHSTAFLDMWQRQADEQVSLEQMIAALDDAGALKHSQAIAKQQTDLALAALEKAKPLGVAGQELERLTLSLLKRQQ
jgi:geranylgeranyl diphosphate synthase type I